MFVIPQFGVRGGGFQLPVAGMRFHVADCNWQAFARAVEMPAGGFQERGDRIDLCKSVPCAASIIRFRSDRGRFGGSLRHQYGCPHCVMKDMAGISYVLPVSAI
jgi:hypothetical protein